LILGFLSFIMQLHWSKVNNRNTKLHPYKIFLSSVFKSTAPKRKLKWEFHCNCKGGWIVYIFSPLNLITLLIPPPLLNGQPDSCRQTPVYSCHSLKPWGWKQHVPLKYWYLPTRLHSATTQKKIVSFYSHDLPLRGL
jgi:hypothetical protein